MTVDTFGAARQAVGTTWWVYQNLASMWATLAVTNEEYAARACSPQVAEIFRARERRARRNAHRLQLLADWMVRAHHAQPVVPERAGPP